MVCRWLLVASLSCWGVVRVQAQAAPAAAAAEDRTEEAKGLFNAGRAAFDAGRYQDALDYFRRSYAISGRAGLLYNIALAHDRLRDDERALEAYEEYLRSAPEAANRVEVETRAEAIRSALSRRQSAEPVSVPTPAEAAAAAPPPAKAAAAPARTEVARADVEPEASGGLLSQWWFWTAVGVAVAGGVTAGVLVAGGGEDEPEPLAPRSGVVVTTLRRTP